MVDNKGSVRLFAVGDIMLGEGTWSYGHGVGSCIEKLGPLFPFERCADALKEADILFGNLEVVLSAFDKAKDPFNRIYLRGQPAAIEGLVSAGFDVLSLANNHSMQHGRKALEETMEILRKHSLAVTGIDIPQQDIENSCVLERKGLKVVFLGYNFRPQQYFLDPPLYVAGDIDKIRRYIRFSLRRKRLATKSRRRQMGTSHLNSLWLIICQEYIPYLKGFIISLNLNKTSKPWTTVRTFL